MKSHCVVTVIISILVILGVSFYFAYSKDATITDESFSTAGIQPIPTTGVDTGYYVILNVDRTPSTNEAPVPYGYKLDSTGQPARMTNAEFITYNATHGIVDRATTSGTAYNTNNYSVEYHDQVPQDDPTNESNGTWVKDPATGKAVYMPWTKTAGTITYYTPGAYPYGAATYVPSYEDSIYLSRRNW